MEQWFVAVRRGRKCAGLRPGCCWIGREASRGWQVGDDVIGSHVRVARWRGVRKQQI